MPMAAKAAVESEADHDLAIHQKVAGFKGRWPTPFRLQVNLQEIGYYIQDIQVNVHRSLGDKKSEQTGIRLEAIPNK